MENEGRCAHKTQTVPTVSYGFWFKNSISFAFDISIPYGAEFET